MARASSHWLQDRGLQLKAHGSQFFFEVPARTYRPVRAGKDKS